MSKDKNGGSQPSICTFFLEGKCKFDSECRNLHPVDKLAPHLKKLHLKKSNDDKGEEGDLQSKKPSMKTSSDVISRLQWDERLPEEHFVVGYLDRFKGIIEKPFAVFDWGNPAAADIFSLSIPKHRIQYFKYKHRKVWDKNERLDMVFGSIDASLPPIYDLMEEADLEQQLILEMAEDECNTLTDRKPKEGLSMDLRPNFFISIKPPGTLENISKIQSELIEMVPSLEYCVLDSSIHHITVSLLKLDSFGDVASVNHALKQNSRFLFGDSPINLSLKGIGTFSNRIIYLKVEDTHELECFVERLNKLLQDTGIQIINNYTFNPHLTLMKVPKNCTAQKLPSDFGCRFSDYEVGAFLLDNIQLCTMGKTEDGSYNCISKFTRTLL